jgi:hypothetical protein
MSAWASAMPNGVIPTGGAIASFDIHTYCQGEGLSPGYWANHTSEYWHNYPATSMFNDVFRVNVFTPDIQIVNAFEANGSQNHNIHIPSWANMDKSKKKQWCTSVYDLCNQIVAALQNAATDIKYDLNPWQVIESFKYAYEQDSFIGSTTSMDNLKNQLDILNNQSG